MENQGQQGVINEAKQTQTYMQRFLKDIKQVSHHSQSHLFMKIVLGKFYIQAYRVFKHFPQTNSAILFKRQQSTTSYVFLLVLDNLSCFHVQSLREQNPIKRMKTLIERIKRKKEGNYVVSVVLVRERKKLTFRSEEEYESFLVYCRGEGNVGRLAMCINAQPFRCFPQQQLKQHSQQSPQPHHPTYPQIQCFTPSFSKQHQQLLFQTRQQITNLKQLLTTYLDTFANPSKCTLLQKLIQRSTASFSINMLLNTVNYIIFQQMTNTCYSQIEPCYWTCYEASKRCLVSDRKHVVLAGQGEVCVLEVIFMREIESEDKKEYDMMLADYRRFYKKAKIKIVRITNQKWDGCPPRINLQDEQDSSVLDYKLSNSQLIYKFHITTVRQFTSTSQQR